MITFRLVAKGNNRSAKLQTAPAPRPRAAQSSGAVGGSRRRASEGPLAQAEAALALGDTRRARSLARQALAADRDAALALLERTRVDPLALAAAAAVLLVIAGAAFFALFHGAS